MLLESGTVTKVDKDKITIKSADGKKHEVQLYNHFPLNDKSPSCIAPPL